MQNTVPQCLYYLLIFVHFEDYQFGRGYVTIENKYWGRINKIPHIPLVNDDDVLKYKMEKVDLEEVWEYLFLFRSFSKMIIVPII